MKTKLYLVFLLMFWLYSCTPKDSSNDFNYIDSLSIELPNITLKASIVNTDLKNLVRPYTMVFDNHLIVLNKRDSFYSFKLANLERDLKYENQLNVHNLKRAFVISDTLFGLDSTQQVYYLTNDKGSWLKYSCDLPFFNSKPIYENDRYLCYSICHGEYGGILFFLNKLDRKITFCLATCVVSLMEHKNSFYVVSSLAHMDGYSEIMKVENPDNLKVLPDSMYTYQNWDNIFKYYPLLNNSFFPDDDSYKHVFSRSQKLLSSGFRILGKNYFLTKEFLNSEFSTFLARIENDSIRLIKESKELFKSLPISSGEITRKIGNDWVIDFTAFANDPKEWEEKDTRDLLIATFIVRDSSIIRINWLKQ